MRRYVFGFVTLVGVLLAFAGIPFYKAELAMCYIAPPPLQAVRAFSSEVWHSGDRPRPRTSHYLTPAVVQSFIPVTVFYTLPVGLSLLVLTTGCLALARFVRQQQKKSAKWDAQKKLVQRASNSTSATQGTGSDSGHDKTLRRSTTELALAFSRRLIQATRKSQSKKKHQKDVFRKVFVRSAWYMAR